MLLLGACMTMSCSTVTATESPQLNKCDVIEAVTFEKGYIFEPIIFSVADAVLTAPAYFENVTLNTIKDAWFEETISPGVPKAHYTKVFGAKNNRDRYVRMMPTARSNC